MTAPLLSVENLEVRFGEGDGAVRAVDGVSFEVYPGETLGIVGESGSGKSVTIMALLGLIPQPPGRVTAGVAYLEGRDLLSMSKRQLRKIRGRDIGMIFQDAMTALNPVLPIGFQIVEALTAHQPDLSRKDAQLRAVELLAEVGVPNPAERARQYAHEYSGGMRQRAMIAMAMANRPKLLIADEPTTALDVTIQAQVLAVLANAKLDKQASTIIITHDLGVIAEMADRVAVMYAGNIVELGTVEQIFDRPRHPYTVGLMSSLPRLDSQATRLIPIRGNPPNARAFPTGCRFHDRCDLAKGREICTTTQPPLLQLGDLSASRCHFPDEVQAYSDALREASQLTHEHEVVTQ
jgi:oligopeptide/dipeptide ABC transporter ATP-binding protein